MTLESASVTRRTFLASTAATAAALGTGLVRAEPPEEKPADKTIGFALVGIGTLTMTQLLPAFAKCKIARPVALVSGHPDKARAQASKYGIDPKNIYNYENFDLIKDNPAIDVVYVVLPNSMHAGYTIRAAKAGKHVLCEKPMATSVADCQAMIDACNAAQRKLMIGYRLHYEPLTQKAIELARSLGTIKQITAEGGFSIGDPTQWRLNRELAGGGSLMDIGIYALNAVRYLSGQEPIEVYATSYSTPDDSRFKQVEETISFELRFDSGLLASCLSSYGFGCNRFRVHGTNGQIESVPFLSYEGDHLWQIHGPQREEVEVEHANHFAAEMDHYSGCILDNKPTLTPGEEGLKDLKIMMAAYQSAQTGQVVKIT
jgi:predicted dehydrogenase